MKTLKSYEAIQVADEYDIPLYDVNYKCEVTLNQVREFVGSGRDPESFTVQNWPSTDKEAELIVQSGFQRMLFEKRMSEACIADITRETDDGESIHPRAAELAAQRLVQEGKLLTAGLSGDGQLYRLPRTFYFKNEFMELLRSQVCDECARLDIEGPFHEPCLLALIDVLTDARTMHGDIAEERVFQKNAAKDSRLHRPNIDMQWLSKKASETKTRMQSVLRPLFTKTISPTDEDPDATIVHKVENLSDNPQTTSIEAVEMPHESVDEINTERQQITKEELIRYIRSVEIIDKNGELTELQRERTSLLNQLDAKEREIQQMERQHQYLQKQCEEMQHDMDTLIQAMQITKRRVQNPAAVIDATISSESIE